MVLDARVLALVLHEEFLRDGWGDIDPYLFYYVATSGTTTDDCSSEDTEALKKVLERVTKRLSEEG